MEEKAKKTIPAQVLLDKARRYCALSEQCETSVRQKLIAWGAGPSDVEAVVDNLRADGYLDDMRYAKAYAESKMLHQHWGRQKVLYQLRLKRLSKEAVTEAMAMVPDEVYYRILADEATKKMRLLGEDTPDNQRRLTAFLASRGYTLGEINHVINNTTAL